MEPVRIGVMGTGALGRHHARLLSSCECADLIGIYDVNIELSRRVAEEFGTTAFESLDELVDVVEGMSVAVPASFHHQTVLPLLEAGRHVLVENPLTPSSAEGRELVAAAREHAVVFAVGHIERFNPALGAFRGLHLAPAFIEARRLSSFPPPRPGALPRNCDVSVVFDLMIHDIDLVLSCVDGDVVDIHCVGTSVASDYLDVASAWLTFDTGCVAQLQASRIAAEPCRTFVVHADNTQYCLDLTQGNAQILRGAKGRGVDVESPTLITWNALEKELEDFCRCIQRRRHGEDDAQPRIPGEAALRAVELAEQVERCATWKTRP